ncbi:hypothetical protein [Variovorax boronicumulans]|uniref:hypothetical protein n=1 Tax=Variovorax boronicumulans TaxID=436515 RepID=UPI0027D78A5A|nr:hypothetical protein [Variovorax boronicumulans]
MSRIPPKAPLSSDDRRADGTTVREAMLRRDADIDSAMRALRAAVRDIHHRVAEMLQHVDSSPPSARSHPVPCNAHERSSTSTLACEIHEMTSQIRSMESVLGISLRSAPHQLAPGIKQRRKLRSA